MRTPRSNRVTSWGVTIEGRGNRMRIVTLLLCAVALAGCASTDAAQDTAVAVAPPPAAPAAAEPPRTVAPGSPRSTLPRGSFRQAAPAPTTEDDGPMTREKIASQCWMKAEANNVRLSLDKRAEIVDKCVNERLREIR